MRIAIWTPKGATKKDATIKRAYLNGLPCLAGGAKAYLAPAGEGLTLHISESAPGLRENVINELVAAGVLSSGADPLASKSFAEIEDDVSKQPKSQRGASPRSPSTGFGAAQRVGVGTRHDEADALDLATIPVPDPIFIRIDHREPDALFALFDGLQNPHINVERVELPVGDIEIYGKDTHYVIERKSCAPGEARTDFEDSVVGEGKRLFFQSEKMRLEEGIVPIVLLEGCAHEHSRGMLLQQIDGMLSYLVTIQKANVFTTYSLNHTGYFILKLAAHDMSGLITQPALRGKKPRQQADQLAFVLEGCPGISTGLARELAAHFGSLAAFCQASEKELLSIKGLGPKRLAQLKGVLYGEP